MKSVRTNLNAFLMALLTTVASSFATYAQCLPVPPTPTCAVGGAIPLTEGAVLTTGNTYTVTGTLNLNAITMNGGTLVICGTLNLANLTFTSGNIQVAPGAAFNYTNGSTALVMGANSSMINFGTVNFSSSIVTGANNLLYNAALTSVFTIPFNQLVIQGPNTFLVNNGLFNSNFFIVQSNNSPGVICAGNGSAITTGIMINQFANGFLTPVGTSCVQITNQIINSQPMTTTPNLNICYQSGSVTVVQGPNFGSATVNPTCPNCSTALPVMFMSAKATCYNEKIHVNWETGSEPTPCIYAVQSSPDGDQFEDVSILETNQTSEQAASYSAELALDYVTELGYVRVRRTAPDNTTVYSQKITVDCSEEAQVWVFPTMLTGNELTVTSNEPIATIVLYATDGKRVQVFEANDQFECKLQLDSDIAIGQYILSVQAQTIRTDKLLRIIR